MILRMRRHGPPRAFAMAIAALLIVAASALAGPTEVLEDYQRDGSIDEPHSIEDLRRALDEVQDTSLYGRFREAVQIELNERIAGVRSRDSSSPPANSASEGGAGGDVAGARGSQADGAAAKPEAAGEGQGGRTQTEESPAAAGGAGGGDDDPGAGEAAGGTTLVPRARERAQEGRTGSAAPEDTADSRARDITGLSAGNELPQPPRVAPGDHVPLVFLALSIAAALLLVGGVVSAVYRRTALHRGR